MKLPRSIITILLFVMLMISSFSILLQVSVQVQGEEFQYSLIFQDDFEAYGLDTFPSKGGWELVWNGRGDEYQRVTDEYWHSPTRSLQLWGQDGWSAVAERRFSSDSMIIGFEGCVLIESYSSKPSGTPVAARIYLWNRELATWGKLYAGVDFTYDGNITARHGLGTPTFGRWSPKTWYRVKLILDKSANTFDVWINGELVGDDISVLPEYQDTYNINALALYSDHAGVKVYFDDVKVFTQTEEFSYEYWLPWTDNTWPPGSCDLCSYIQFLISEDNTIIQVDSDHDGVADAELSGDAGEKLTWGYATSYGSPKPGLDIFPPIGTLIKANKPITAFYYHSTNDWGIYDDHTYAYGLIPTSLLECSYYIWTESTLASILSTAENNQVFIDENDDGDPEYSFTLGYGEYYIYSNTKAGTHIWAEKPIAVVVANWDPSYDTETYAYALYPVSMLSSEYSCPYPNPGIQYYEDSANKCKVIIGAVHEDTTVNIDEDSDGAPEITQSLGKAQYYEYRNPKPGAKIYGTKEFYTIYIFDIYARDPWASVYRDYMYAYMIPPASISGKQFLMLDHYESYHAVYTSVNIFVLEDETEIYVDRGFDGTADETYQANKGEVINIVGKLRYNLTKITTNKPVTAAYSWEGGWAGVSEAILGFTLLPLDILAPSGRPFHPAPQVSLKIVPISELEGKYRCEITLKNLGEDSLYSERNKSGVHVQLINAEITDVDKGTFDEYLCQFEYPLKIVNEANKIVDYAAIEFYKYFIGHGEENTASFNITVGQAGFAVIGYRAWIYDKNDLVKNEVEVHNRYEPYIARDPEDYNYNRHVHDYTDVGAIYELQDGFYYVNFTFLDYRCYFKTIPEKWSVGRSGKNVAYLGQGTLYWSKTEMDKYLKELWNLNITEVYVNVADVTEDGNVHYNEKMVEFIKEFKSRPYGKNIKLLAWVNMGYAASKSVLLNEELIQKAAENIYTTIMSHEEFDGIHCDFEFKKMGEEELSDYDKGLIKLLNLLDSAIGSKILSVYIPTGERWNTHIIDGENLVTKIGNIADEVVPDVYGGVNYMYLGETYHAIQIYRTYDELVAGTKAELVIAVPAYNMFRLDGIKPNVNPDKRQKLAYALVGVEIGHLISCFLKSDLLGLLKKPTIALYHYTPSKEGYDEGMNDYDLYVFKRIWLSSFTRASAELSCPADLHLYDEYGRHVGVNYETGEIEVEIPGAHYTGPDVEPQIIWLDYPPDGVYRIEIVGKDYGNFSLKIEGFYEGNPIFQTQLSGIIEPKIICSLSLNISSQPTPLTIQTIGAPIYYIKADVGFSPTTLNLRSKGKWITAYVELPESYNVTDIGVSSILLNDTIPVDLSAPIAVGDHNEDGIPDLIVKFDRAELTLYILTNVGIIKLFKERFMTTTLTLTGKLNDGTPFQGSCTIRIIMPC